jgi:hypothetical protein
MVTLVILRLPKSWPIVLLETTQIWGTGLSAPAGVHDPDFFAPKRFQPHTDNSHQTSLVCRLRPDGSPPALSHVGKKFCDNHNPGESLHRLTR